MGDDLTMMITVPPIVNILYLGYVFLYYFSFMSFKQCFSSSMLQMLLSNIKALYELRTFCFL